MHFNGVGESIVRYEKVISATSVPNLSLKIELGGRYVQNPKRVEIRKTFTPGIYETFTPYPDVHSINDILHIILRGSAYTNYKVDKDKGSISRN